MISKTTSFKKMGKGKKGNFKKNGKKVSTPRKKPKAGPKPELSACTAKGLVIGSRTAPNTWGSSTSSDQTLCSRNTQFQALV